VINFINSLWVPCHVTMGLFETTYMSGITMTLQVKDFLSLYKFLNKLIACVKNKGAYLSTLAQAFSLVVNCGLLRLFTMEVNLYF
jgi:hypothetical protein